MGLSTRFDCPACGYATAELFVGQGEVSERWLVSCASCKTLQDADRKALSRGCTRHGTPFTVHDDDEPHCPRCDVVLTCVPLGTWD